MDLKEKIRIKIINFYLSKEMKELERRFSCTDKAGVEERWMKNGGSMYKRWDSCVYKRNHHMLAKMVTATGDIQRNKEKSGLTRGRI